MLIAAGNQNRAGRGRRIAASAAVVVAMTGGLAACGESGGPEAGGVTTEELTSVQEDLTALEERVGAIEENMGAPLSEESGQAQPEIIGQEVTVSAEVSEIITSTDVGSAFRIAGGEGPSVAVLATKPPQGLDVNDVVQITGTVKMVQRSSFEQDFGIADDELFDDPDAFFNEAEGQPAIAADNIEVLQEQAES